MNQPLDKFCCNEQCFDTFVEMIHYAYREHYSHTSFDEFVSTVVYQMLKKNIESDVWTERGARSLHEVFDWLNIPSTVEYTVLSLKERIALYQLNIEE